MNQGGKAAVLLVAHGTPENADDIPCFLHAVTGGRELPQAVIDEVQHRYALIGRSPLLDFSRKQAEAVQRELGLPVYLGMRNWTPYIREVAPQMAVDGVARAVVICLAPQNSRTSVGLYRKAVADAQAAAALNGGKIFTTDFVESWHDHPLLAAAFAEKLEPGWKRACREAGSDLPVIFTAHSVPERTIAAGDPYERQARETAALVVAKVGGPVVHNWRFAFQSQGMSGGPWLGPTVEETMLALKQEGHKGIFLQPVGFLCDHVEVLYDIDIAFRQFAQANGLKLWRAESLNDSPLLAAALAGVARKRIG
jgi:ferrochelatase